jgi:hypothetical protein
MTMTSDEQLAEVQRQIRKDVERLFNEMLAEMKAMSEELVKLIDATYAKRIAALNEALARLGVPPPPPPSDGSRRWH